MGILVFVDPTPEEQDLAIELAVTMAEYCMVDPVPLDLLCDAATALEIGVSVLGQQPARLAEGGAERPSPIRLLPPLRRPNTREHAAPERGEDGSGDLDLLFDLGLFADAETPEGRPHRAEREGRERRFRLDLHIALAQPTTILGLGRKSSLWATVETAQPGRLPRLILIGGLFPERMRRWPQAVLRGAEDPVSPDPARDGAAFRDEDADREDTIARRQGALVADLLELCADLAGGGR